MATTNLGKVSVTPKGEYDPLITYERLDVISHNGSSYIVKQTSTGVTPIEGEFYALIAEKGDGGSFVKKAYKTYAAMDTDKVNIPANSSVDVTNDPDESKNGAYIYDGEAFARSQYDSKVVTDKIIADTAIAVQDAINNTAVEGGVLADTFVVKTANGLGQVARNQRDKNAERVSVKDFGAVGDGVADDTSAIQAAIDYCQKSGHELNFPPCADFYLVSEPLVISVEGVTYVNPALRITGNLYKSRIVMVSDTVQEAVIHIPTRVNYISIENIWIDANEKARYGITTADTIYAPYFTMYRVFVTKATETQIYLNTYVSSFTNVFASRGKKGFEIGGVEASPATSITMNSCYVNFASEVAYDFGHITNSALNACACDNSKLAYKFRILKGVTMNGCGAEKVEKFLLATAYRGLVINSPYTLNMGSLEDGGVAEEYAIELVAGTGASISGVDFNYRNTPPKYKLGLTSDSYGYNDVFIADFTIRPAQVFQVNTYAYPSKNSIKGPFFSMLSRPDVKEIALAPDVKLELAHTDVGADLTYKLEAGVYTNVYISLQNLKGSNTIYISGATTTPSDTTLSLYYLRGIIKDVSCTVVFKNLTITCAESSAFTKAIQVISGNVVFDNVVFDSGGKDAGAAITATLYSKVQLINETKILPSTKWKGVAALGNEVLYVDSSSKVDWRGETPPATVATTGQRFEVLKPTAGGVATFVNTAGAAKTAVWVALTTVSAV